MGGVIAALDRPDTSAVFTQWALQPIAVVLAAALLLGYVRGVRTMGRRNRPWPVWRTTVFTLGLVVCLWASCGFAQVYGDSLYWVWTAQTLTLWLVVPILVLSGHPVQLARAIGGHDSRLDRLLRSRFARVVGNPLVGPALVPVLSGALFFGPVPGWAISSPPAGWVLQLALVLVGAPDGPAARRS